MPLAASLLLHAGLLAAIGPGAAGPAAADGISEGKLVVRLAQGHQATQTKSARAAPSEVPLAFTGPAPTRYFTSAELDERAIPVETAALVYPEKAYRNRIAGKVRLRIYVSDAGRVERTDVLMASPRGHFEQAAVDAVRATRFHPARKAGRAVPSQKVIEVEFDPYGPTPEDRS